mgnify:FL=1
MLDNQFDFAFDYDCAPTQKTAVYAFVDFDNCYFANFGIFALFVLWFEFEQKNQKSVKGKKVASTKVF